MASVQSLTTSTDESRQSTLREIKSECEVTWEHIQETHHKLASDLENRPGVGVENANASVKILQHKERRLKAELEILRTQDIEVVSKDPKFVEALLRNDVKNSIEQLQATLVIIKGQRQELASEIQRERKILEEQEEIQRVLQDKIQAFQEQDDIDQSQDRVLQDLQTRKKQANKYHLNSMKQLGTFLTTYFPRPDDNISKNKTIDAKRPKSYCTLQHQIEVLMNHLFDSPHDPYIKLLPTYWPPYIELLLRYGIIQRHPDDCNLIRLVAYHMKQ